MQRLTDAFAGFKSADKLREHWRSVWPRYTRPFAGPAFLLHSYDATALNRTRRAAALDRTRSRATDRSAGDPAAPERAVCDLLCSNEPFRRLLIQGSPNGAYVAPTSRAACIEATRPARQDKRASVALLDKVCSLLPEQPQRPRAAAPVEMVESRHAFWQWMRANNLTYVSPMASRVARKSQDLGVRSRFS